MKIKNVLVTGASGKIGRSLIPVLVKAGYNVRAIQFKTPVKFEKVEVVQGSVSDEKFVGKVFNDIDAVCHLATCKEDREHFIDTSIKGTFNLLEECRRQKVKQFILAGGDASLGIFYYPHRYSLDENAPLAAYPGYYAFSKVMEETMCQQYQIQYGLPVTILRFSWIHDEDDILAYMTLMPPDFGGPAWEGLAKTKIQKEFFKKKKNGVGCLLHPDKKPFIRHIVGILDVIQSFMLALGNKVAINQTFNIAAPSAFSYDILSKYISKKLDLPVVEFTSDNFYDFTIDITKAKSGLGYKPQYDIFKIVDSAIEFRKVKKRNAVKYNG
ncbi:MAG: NAD(P)-dependent oxidoreductase [Candidatus Firestonebacteria bacterium]